MSVIEEKKNGVADLLNGTLDIGLGVRISPITDGKQLTAIRFEHDVYEGHADAVGVCSKILPLTKRGTFSFLQRNGHWKLLHIGRGKGLELTPSICCTEHHLHGFIREGRWLPYRTFVLGLWTDEIREARLRQAEAEAEEFGGGLEGALLAIASRMVPVRSTYETYPSRSAEEWASRRAP